MFDHRGLRAFSFSCLVLFLAGCGNPSGLNSIQVAPTTQSVTIGQTAQFTAVGTYGNANHPKTQNLTSTVTWTSSIPAVATISTSGVAKAVTAGTTTITANATAFNGPVNASATLIVTGSGGGSGQANLLSITIIPSSITVGNLQDTGQFLAIGTFSTAPIVRDLTNSPSLIWISSAPSVFPVNTNTAGNAGATAGIVTAYGNGSANIIAESKGSDGSIQTAQATFSCPLVLPNPPTTPGSCYPGSQAAALLATLTVYNEGLNTTGWLVTAPSATGTPSVLSCGPGSTSGSVCSATYPVGTIVTLTAPAEPGVAFGGWSSNCTATAPISAAGPNSCTVILTTNDTVGAIFN
ncbi:MAG TPA: Ig-like domain-containing protein [Acidobacteriaceae bacterium]|nr:Ig-like domain-containing protein [Acidobacteriaceae bacterium]